jgi:hypothetical protein
MVFQADGSIQSEVLFVNLTPLTAPVVATVAGVNDHGSEVRSQCGGTRHAYGGGGNQSKEGLHWKIRSWKLSRKVNNFKKL